jgi:hypothetical protein
MAKRYIEVYAPNLAELIQQTTRVHKLGEGFIIESLVELSGQVTTSEQLMEFFNAKRIEAGLVNLLTVFSETREGSTDLEDAGVSAAIGAIEQVLKGHFSSTICLATAFTEQILLRLEFLRRSPFEGAPSFVTNLDSLPADPSLFDRVKLLIARGELKGSVWKSRSTWGPLLTSVFESFHQSLKNLSSDLNNKAPNPVRDLLKYHPSPLSLLFQGDDSETGLSGYAYTGGHEKAVELNVATEIELGLDSAARKEMAVGVVWLNQLDVGNSTRSLDFPHAVPVSDPCFILISRQAHFRGSKFYRKSCSRT